VSTTVTVACNLPRGIVCELGLELDYATSRFIKTPAYKRIRLGGSQRSTLIALPKGVQPVATRGLEPGLTEGIDREFITEWLRQHPRMAQHVWVVENPKADLRHQVGDRPPAPFEPLDPTKPFTVGLGEVTKANFNEP
jgi:hypothetical protein